MNGARSQFYMSYGPVQPYKAISHKPGKISDFLPAGDPYPTSILFMDLGETVSTPQVIFRLVQQTSPIRRLPPRSPPPVSFSPFWIKAWAEDGSAAPLARTQ